MIQLDGVRKGFSDRLTLDGLTLKVPEGGVVGLAGRLGAGKTTVLRIPATLVPADQGSVTVAGIPVDRDPAGVRQMIGYLPETTASTGA